MNLHWILKLRIKRHRTEYGRGPTATLVTLKHYNSCPLIYALLHPVKLFQEWSKIYETKEDQNIVRHTKSN
jgi:hypothetical protein